MATPATRLHKIGTPAIHTNNLAAHITRIITDQEQDQVSDILWGTNMAKDSNAMGRSKNSNKSVDEPMSKEMTFP